MPKTKHTVTLPDGKTAQRVSQNRTYSHVVVCRTLYEVALRDADRISTGDLGNYRFHREFVDGTSRFLVRASYERDDAQFAARCAKDIARSVEELAGVDSAQAYAEAKRAERVAAVEAKRAAGGFDRWWAGSWSSRLDLAQKACGEFTGYAETRVLPCERA